MKDNIKTADEVLQKALDKAYTIQELEKGIIEPDFIQEAMKKYAKQFIDLAAEEATVTFFDWDNQEEEYEDIYELILYSDNAGAKVNKESILKVKQLIK